ncbi:MAG: D-alanyl-D-alanine carboxypeptidase [Oscillospiraceae bacterium]|nr:D-alanyl-D-alanine carboxypeptidase [Oscillospiraceae bacterium]
MTEENTDEYENETVNVFSTDIIAVMTGADSFVEKIAGPENFDVPCKAAFLIEQRTGQVLYEKYADEQLPMASITKIMTMLLVMEALDDGKITINDTVPVSEHAFSMGGSQVWLEPGEIFTVGEMLKAVAVSSANDAAVALAELVGGTEEAFCDTMNRKAEQLGMVNTHFVNACGLDADGHYSTAKDIAIMAAELMKHQEIFDYTTIWMDYLRGGETQLVNTNKLLRSYNGITGLKTGTTSKAGVCICATATRENMSLIAVVLGADSSRERFSAAKKLLDFGFTNFETRSFPDISHLPGYIPVKLGVEKNVPIECKTPDKLLFVKGSTSRLTVEIELPEYISAPMYKGMKAGALTLYGSQGKIKEYPILLSKDTVRMDFSTAFTIMIDKVASM